MCFFLCISHEALVGSDEELADIESRKDLHAKEKEMKLLEIKELHPDLQREVTRHKFPGATGINNHVCLFICVFVILWIMDSLKWI